MMADTPTALEQVKADLLAAHNYDSEPTESYALKDVISYAAHQLDIIVQLQRARAAYEAEFGCPEYHGKPGGRAWREHRAEEERRAAECAYPTLDPEQAVQLMRGSMHAADMSDEDRFAEEVKV